MATLLDAVNQVLKDCRVLQGDAVLTTLVDPPRQIFIDLAIQKWGETIDQLYVDAQRPVPRLTSTGTITLVAGVRNYALPADIVTLHYPLRDTTNGDYIVEYNGGFMQIVRDQSRPSDYIGLPTRAALDPETYELYLDTDPTAEEAGRVYEFRYDKDHALTGAADVMPLGTAVYRAMIPAVAELWRRARDQDDDPGNYRRSYGRALRLLNGEKNNSNYLATRSSGAAGFDPYASE